MKKRRVKIAITMAVIGFLVVLLILVYTGVISFLFNGFEYIDSNEEQYVINSTVLSEDKIMNFCINESIDIDGVTFSIISIDMDKTSLEFTVLINNSIHFSYGKILSQKYPFDNFPASDAKNFGQIYIEYNNQSYKCERRFITYGKNTIEYSYSLEFDGIQISEIDNARIRIADFCLTEYKKR